MLDYNLKKQAKDFKPQSIPWSLAILTCVTVCACPSRGTYTRITAVLIAHTLTVIVTGVGPTAINHWSRDGGKALAQNGITKPLIEWISIRTWEMVTQGIFIGCFGRGYSV